MNQKNKLLAKDGFYANKSYVLKFNKVIQQVKRQGKDVVYELQLLLHKYIKRIK